MQPKIKVNKARRGQGRFNPPEFSERNYAALILKLAKGNPNLELLLLARVPDRFFKVTKIYLECAPYRRQMPNFLRKDVPDHFRRASEEVVNSFRQSSLV